MSLTNTSLVVTSYQIVRNLFTRDTSTKIKLGRWGVNTKNKTYLLADYSNEDHCGTCAQYISTKRPLDKENLAYEFESISLNNPTITKSNK